MGSKEITDLILLEIFNCSKLKKFARHDLNMNPL